jgi:hypothetical protein
MTVSLSLVMQQRYTQTDMQAAGLVRSDAEHIQTNNRACETPTQDEKRGQKRV